LNNPSSELIELLFVFVFVFAVVVVVAVVVSAAAAGALVFFVLSPRLFPFEFELSPLAALPEVWQERLLMVAS
jgi:hypothetical protein